MLVDFNGAHDADTGAALWLIDNAHVGVVTALALGSYQHFALTGAALTAARS